MERAAPSRTLGRLGIAAFLLGAGAFLILAEGSTSTVVVTVFWSLEGIATLLALVVLFWRGRSMPVWGRVAAGLTLVVQAAFVWVLARGLSQLT